MRQQQFRTGNTDKSIADSSCRLLSEANGQERVLSDHQLCRLNAPSPHCVSALIALQTRLGILARLVMYPRTSPPRRPNRNCGPLLLASETIQLALIRASPLRIWGAETSSRRLRTPILHAPTVPQVISNVIYQRTWPPCFEGGSSSEAVRQIWRRYEMGDLEYTYIGHIFFQFFVLWRWSRAVSRTKRKAGTVETKA